MGICIACGQLGMRSDAARQPRQRHRAELRERSALARLGAYRYEYRNKKGYHSGCFIALFLVRSLLSVPALTCRITDNIPRPHTSRATRGLFRNRNVGQEIGDL